MSHDGQKLFDINQRNREKQAMNTFARDLESGSLAVRDRIGQAIRVGDMLNFLPPDLVLWQVTDIAPVLDPKAGPGLATVTMACTVPVVVRAGQPTQRLMLYMQGRAQPAADVPSGAVESTMDHMEESHDETPSA